jgi:hypothetical protein
VEAVYATSVVEPENRTRITPVVPGRLAEILVEEGDAVRRSQPLARMARRRVHLVDGQIVE